jgi:hypothetical protein
MRNLLMRSLNLLAALLVVTAGLGISPVAAPAQAQDAAGSAATFETYSRFDFVAGEKIIALEDFIER